MTRDYYIRRIGREGQRPRLSLHEFAEQLAAAYTFVDQQGYLQRSFGYHCVDAKDVPGLDGTDIGYSLYLATGIRIEGVVSKFIAVSEDEATLFTICEFVHDHVAKPAKGAGSFHSFSGCGWHFDCRHDTFDEKAAREEWRAKVNAFLRFYEDGFELAADGEIVRNAPGGLEPLIEVAPPENAADKDRAKVASAIRTFRLAKATREQRQQAVRDLIDILEFHRAAVKVHLSKDEGDLFNIANNFALRHHNSKQKDDYGEDWLTWLFYNYLSTVHLVLGRVHGGVATQAAGASVGQTDNDDLPPILLAKNGMSSSDGVEAAGAGRVRASMSSIRSKLAAVQCEPDAVGQ